jgi:predicted ATPase
VQDGIIRMREDERVVRHTADMKLFGPRYRAQLAEEYGHAGQADKGLRRLAEAKAHIARHKTRLWEPEVYRLEGELRLSHSPSSHAEAETCFRQALDIARSQQAKSLELRAATSLARLWQSQDKRQEAYDLLVPVYGWFTEGFDTADLKDAKTLLDDLA